MEYDIKPTVVLPAQGVLEHNHSTNYKVTIGSSLKRAKKAKKLENYIETPMHKSGCRHQL